MALTKDKKNQVVEDIAGLLVNSKMTVIATYQGTPVKAMQELRRSGRDNSTTLKVVKNRLVIQAIKSTEHLKNVATDALNGMLIYAFNDQDEVAPAQTLASFAKTQPTLKFVGAISSEGKFLSSDEVTALATLPGKNELIAQVLATLASPTNEIINGLQGNLHGILDALAQKASI
ncbi:50S ribosomal protein L10 [Candidatus Saccharibacteria bacterium]|nr:50S ribosomal protein L10 [Candidatus Saccharibacteria bacterium]MBI3337979.1 50S ribosomal protein L10 [Candidatus Saccharibacteria bacterium]